MIRRQLFSKKSDFFVALLISLPVLWALLPGGMPNTADSPVHFIRSAEMIHAWQGGVFLPRWAQNLGYGYGIPLFNYAPPLPYLITAALHSLGLSLESAFKVMTAIGVLTGAVGAYRMNRALFPMWAAVVGVAAFVYAPIQLRELFIQGNVGQYLAWAFPPWAAWAIIRLYSTRRLRYAAALAFALLGVLLCHNVAALLMMGLIGGLAISLFLFTHNWYAFLASIGGSALGLAVSAWFWVPALLEGRYIQLSRIVTSDFRTRFIPLADLLALSPPLDTSTINPFFPLTLGAVQVWLGALGVAAFLLIALTRRIEHRRGLKSAAGMRTDGIQSVLKDPEDENVFIGAGLFFILFTLFCGFMALAWSEPLWSALPFLDLFEWPFRWHGYTAVGLSWLCTCAVYGIGKAVTLRRRNKYAFGGPAPLASLFVSALALLIVIASALVNLYPQKLLPDARSLASADVVRYEVDSSAVGTTSLGEFNPIWIDGALHDSPLVEDYLAGRPINRLPKQLPPGASGVVVENGAQHQRFRLNLPAPATLTLNLLYFPGWQADVDGAPLEIEPHSGSGLIDVKLPAGEHTLSLTFGETQLRRTADWISLVAWLGLALTWVLWALLRHRRAALVSLESQESGLLQETSSLALGSRFLTAAGLFVALPVALVLSMQIVFPNWFRLHSQLDQALGASVPLHVDFYDADSTPEQTGVDHDKLRLLGVNLPPDTVAQGAALTVVSYWRALQPLHTDYSIFLHLDDPMTGETIAATDQLHPGDIPTSDWATGLHVRDPLQLQVPVDALPIRYSLRVGVYNSQSSDLLASANRLNFAEVGQVWVLPEKEVQPPAGPRAAFGTTVHLLGIVYETSTQELVFYWRADAPPEQTAEKDATIFVHLLNSKRELVGQLDGAPNQNRYLLSDWRPGQVIEDRRSLAGLPVDNITSLAVGIYDLADGERWSVTCDDESAQVADNALLVELAAIQR